MSIPLLTTKLNSPALRPGYVPRPRLVERLNSRRPLVLISAPAGFGKTTLVKSWLASAGQPFTWLSLDQGDNDPVRFVAYLVAALAKIDDGIGTALQGLTGAQQFPPLETLATILINAISTVEEDFILVLDDYHIIRDEWVHQMMAFLIDNQPTQLQAVLFVQTGL